MIEYERYERVYACERVSAYVCVRVCVYSVMCECECIERLDADLCVRDTVGWRMSDVACLYYY